MVKRLLWGVSDELMERLFQGAYQVEGPVSIWGMTRDDTSAMSFYEIEVDDGEFGSLEMTAKDSFADYAIGGMVQ